MDIEFYKKYPDYKPVGFICQDFSNSINDFQSRFSNTTSTNPINTNPINTNPINTNPINSTSGDINISSVVIGKDEVVLKILKTDMPDIYNLYVLQEKGDEHLENSKIGIAFIPNLVTSQMLYQYFQKYPTDMNAKVICKYHSYFHKWIPLKILNDSKLNVFSNSQLKVITQ